MTADKRWYTVREAADRLHVRPITAWRLVRPFRARCHLARTKSHPRLLLWIPADVLRTLVESRPWYQPG